MSRKINLPPEYSLYLSGIGIKSIKEGAVRPEVAFLSF